MPRGRVFQCFSSALALINVLNIGFCNGWPSPFLPILQNNRLTTISKNEGFWIASIYLIGGPAGAIISCFTIDSIGRKKTILFAAVPSLISWITIANIQNYNFLLFTRFFLGVCDGISYSIVPIYLAEIADVRIRGLLSSFIGVMVGLGVLLINVFGYYTNIRNSALLCASFPLIFILLFSRFPETPNYFMIKRKFEKAHNILAKIYDRGSVEEEFQAINQETNRRISKAGILELITVRAYRKGVLITMGAIAAQQFSGIVPIVFYTQAIFEEAAEDFLPIVSTVLLYTTLILFPIITAFFIDHVGRRPLLIISVLFSGVCLLLLGIVLCIKSNVSGRSIGFSWSTMVIILLLIISYSIGLLAVPTIFLGELLHPNIKAVGVPVCNVFFYVIATAASKTFQFIKDIYGLHVAFFVFAFCCLISLVFITLFVPETKKKKLEEIQIELGSVNITYKIICN